MSETSHIHTDDIIVDADEHFVINTTTRAISSSNNRKLTIMQYDNKSERYSFDIDRVIDGHDLTKCNNIQIHFNNIGSNRASYSGTYKVDDMVINESDENKVTFTWLVGGECTQYSGVLAFLVSFECLDEKANILYRWSSSIFNSIQITTGMDNDDVIFELYSDDLLKWQNEMEVEHIPYLVDKCYIERDFATSEEVVAVLNTPIDEIDTPVTVIPYEEIKTYVDNADNNLQNQITTLQETVENLPTGGGNGGTVDTTEIKADVTALDGRLTRVENNLNTLEETVANLNTSGGGGNSGSVDTTEIEADITALDGRITTVETDLTTLEETVANLNISGGYCGGVELDTSTGAVTTHSINADKIMQLITVGTAYPFMFLSEGGYGTAVCIPFKYIDVPKGVIVFANDTHSLRITADNSVVYENISKSIAHSITIVADTDSNLSFVMTVNLKNAKNDKYIALAEITQNLVDLGYNDVMALNSLYPVNGYVRNATTGAYEGFVMGVLAFDSTGNGDYLLSVSYYSYTSNSEETITITSEHVSYIKDVISGGNEHA